MAPPPPYTDSRYDYLTEPSVHDSVSQVSSRHTVRRSGSSRYDDRGSRVTELPDDYDRRDRRGSDLRRSATVYAASSSDRTVRQRAPSVAASRRSSRDYEDDYARHSQAPGEMIPYRPRSNSVAGSHAPSATPSRRSRAPSMSRPAEYYAAPPAPAPSHAPSRARTYRDLHSGGGAGRSVHPAQYAGSEYGGSQRAGSQVAASAYGPVRVADYPGVSQPHDISPYSMGSMASAYPQPLQSGEFIHNQVMSVRRADGTELRYASSTRAKGMSAYFDPYGRR